MGEMVVQTSGVKVQKFGKREVIADPYRFEKIEFAIFRFFSSEQKFSVAPQVVSQVHTGHPNIAK